MFLLKVGRNVAKFRLALFKLEDCISKFVLTVNGYQRTFDLTTKASANRLRYTKTLQ